MHDRQTEILCAVERIEKLLMRLINSPPPMVISRDEIRRIRQKDAANVPDFIEQVGDARDPI